MDKHKQGWRKLEFVILQTLRFAIMGIMLALMWMFAASMQVASAAGPIKGAIPQNPCATYAALQKTPTDTSVVKVQLLGVQDGVVGVLILGLPKHVQATINGVDLRPYLSDTQQIQCNRKAVGELRSYDLRKLPNMDAGYFKIVADRISAGGSIMLR